MKPSHTKITEEPLSVEELKEINSSKKFVMGCLIASGAPFLIAGGYSIVTWSWDDESLMLLKLLAIILALVYCYLVRKEWNNGKKKTKIILSGAIRGKLYNSLAREFHFDYEHRIRVPQEVYKQYHKDDWVEIHFTKENKTFIKINRVENQ